MEKSNFIDQIRIFAKSGKGGAGSIHFLRTKYNATAGPDGGNGGRGGHIILRGNKNLWTLLHLRYKKNITAVDGGNGLKNDCTGLNGIDEIIEVPLGTIARDEETGNIEAEILEDKQEVVWLRGGIGGKGNAFFRKPTLQTPEFAQPGEKGTEGWKILELKILADVGLVGFPNAGKSTLLATITAAKPKIADYAFTTLSPNLGIVAHRHKHSFCIADLPGIIEGAADGKGIGLRFLRHIERNAVLLFVIAADEKDIAKTWKILYQELQQFNPDLLHKKMLLGISKAELLSEAERKKAVKKLPKTISHLFFSSVTNEGLDKLKDELWQLLQ